MKLGAPLVYSRPEQRAIIVQALGIFPNVWVVYNYVGKRLGVSYGSIPRRDDWRHRIFPRCRMIGDVNHGAA
jgi:hypothetical protein